MKYLNKFDTRSDYQASASTLEIPNVAYITSTTEVIYNTNQKEYITFADPAVEQKCIQLYSTDNIGCTEEDLAAVTAISYSDWSGTSITSFDELEYFTGLTTINAYTFQNCTGLTSVTIPDSVTSIGNSAFAGCSGLTSVTVPDSVTVLEQRVFQSCGHLVSMTLPSGLTAINQYLFANDTNLTAVTIPSGVTSIDIYAFGNCPSLSSITFDATTPPASISNLAFDNNVPSTGNITVPSGSESNFYSLAQTLGANWTVNNQAPPAPQASNYVLFESSATTAEQGTYQITLSGVTISGNSDENKVWLYQTAAYRFLKDCNFDIVSTGGNITKIEFTQKDSSYPVTNISAATGTYTVDSGVGTWEASSPLSTVSFSCPSGQARCPSVKVYLDNS